MTVLTIHIRKPEDKKRGMTKRGQLWEVYHEGEHILTNMYPFNKAARFFLDAGYPSYLRIEMYHEGENSWALGGTLGASGGRRLSERQEGFAWEKWEDEPST